jgi:hypothetical protein
MRSVKHEIKWQPATQEWFCIRCSRTSDHVSQEDAERELSQFDCVSTAESSQHGMRVKLRENSFYLWIIVPSENEHLAWSGSRWVPITSDGLPAGELQKLKNFATVKEAVAYAESLGFEVEHG